MTEEERAFWDVAFQMYWEREILIKEPGTTAEELGEVCASAADAALSARRARMKET